MLVIVRVIVLVYIFFIIGQIFNLGICVLFTNSKESVRCKHNELISIPIGFGITSILTTFLYFMCGCTIRAIFVTLLVLAVLLTVIYLVYVRHDIKNFIVRPFIALCVTLILLFILAVPGLVFGDAEYVWRGNRWDKNIYATEAIAAWSHPIKYYDSMEADQLLLESETLSYGYNLLITDRPTAPIMCSLAFVAGDSYLFSMYLMYMLYMAMVPGAVLFLILGIYYKREKVKENKFGIIAIFIALLYPISFWGQFIYDIDALSEMSTIAIFVIATVSAVRLLSGTKNETVTDYIYLLISMTSGWILYFEDAVVHSFLFVIISVLMLFVIRNKAYTIKLLKVISVPIVGVIAILITNPRLFVFLKSNGGSAFDASRQNWSYFTQYWDGRYGISDSGSIFTILSKVENTFLAWNGLWFITPDYQAPTSLIFKLIWFCADAAVCMIIICLFTVTLIEATKVIKHMIALDDKTTLELGSCANGSWNIKLKNRSIECTLFAMMTFIGLVMFLVMVLFGKPWTANKMLLYISVYTYLLLVYPLFRYCSDNSKIIVFTSLFSIIAICLQVWFASIRIYNEFTNDDHNGIDWNYPSDQDREVKEEYAFNYNELDIDQDAVYILDVNDRLFQLYVKMNLAFDGIQPYNYLNYDFNGNENNAYYPDIDTLKENKVYVIKTQKREDGKECLVIRDVE